MTSRRFCRRRSARSPRRCWSPAGAKYAAFHCSRATFIVVLGTRVSLPADRFHAPQWVGLALSFAGMLVAFGVPTPALDPRQMSGDLMMIAAAVAWAATTLIIKASALNRISSEKV